MMVILKSKVETYNNLYVLSSLQMNIDIEKKLS